MGAAGNAEFTVDMQPRGTTSPASVQLDVPRDSRAPANTGACFPRCAPRLSGRALIAPFQSPRTGSWRRARRAVVHRIKIRQHYETPAAAVPTVRRLWAPDYDVMTSPINAVCEDYGTLEDVFDAPLFGRRIFVNPPATHRDFSTMSRTQTFRRRSTSSFVTCASTGSR